MSREYRGDGSDNGGIPAGMDIITAGTPRKWSANLAVKKLGVHTVFRQTILFEACQSR